MLRAALVVAAIVVVQAGPYAQSRGRAVSRPAAAPRETTVRVLLHDVDGTSIPEARVNLSGDASGEFATGGAGLVILPKLSDGTYRIRCEKDGFVPLEREFTIKGGTPTSIDVV